MRNLVLQQWKRLVLLQLVRYGSLPIRSYCDALFVSKKRNMFRAANKKLIRALDGQWQLTVVGLDCLGTRGNGTEKTDADLVAQDDDVTSV